MDQLGNIFLSTYNGLNSKLYVYPQIVGSMQRREKKKIGTRKWKTKQQHTNNANQIF